MEKETSYKSKTVFKTIKTLFTTFIVFSVLWIVWTSVQTFNNLFTEGCTEWDRDLKFFQATMIIAYWLFPFLFSALMYAFFIKTIKPF